MGEKSKKKTKAAKKPPKKDAKAKLSAGKKTAKHGKDKTKGKTAEALPPDWAQETRYNARFTWVSAG